MYYGYMDNSSIAGDNDASFFRVVPAFVVQFGISGLPTVSQAWEQQTIKDDPVVLSNVAGTIAFATAGPDTRTTQVYVNLADNSGLDQQGFAPFGKITAGMNVVLGLNSEAGQDPDQTLIYSKGNAYLRANFKHLDYVLKTTLK
jgi:peptidyl-prolyl cis-trans isomerase A (cyclophilin A)